MHRARPAIGDHVPDVRIFPRFERIQIYLDSAVGQGFPGVAHHGQAALGKDVDLDQAHRFHGVHVVMRSGQALVRDERGRQFVHRLARQHHAARMHLRAARNAVQEGGHFLVGPVLHEELSDLSLSRRERPDQLSGIRPWWFLHFLKLKCRFSRASARPKLGSVTC